MQEPKRIGGLNDMKPSKIIYSINTEDVQNVAEQKFERGLSQKELKIVEDKIGDYIDLAPLK